MNRRTWSAAGLVMFLLTAPAFAQSGSSSVPAAAAPSGVDTTAAGSSTSGDGNVSIKQLLKSEWTLLMIEAIHVVFQDIRSSLGLPDAPADLASDPLALLESAIVNALNTASSP